MGLERTKSFFEKLKKDGYEIKYFTQRITDTPWISARLRSSVFIPETLGSYGSFLMEVRES